MRRLSFWAALALVLAAAGCLHRSPPVGPGNAKWGVDVTWHGHSCFTIRDSIGRTVVLDPFDETVGYGRLDLRADALLITHSHFDHNNRRAVHGRAGSLELVESTGTSVVAGDMQVLGLPSDHDEDGGAINGPNRIYVFYMGGLRIAHLGDIGQKTLTPEQITELGHVDVLMIPVGGVVTIDAAKAKKFVDLLNPGAVFPMHFGDLRFFRLNPLSDFTRLFPPDRVVTVGDSHIRLRRTDFDGKPRVYLLEPRPTN